MSLDAAVAALQQVDPQVLGRRLRDKRRDLKMTQRDLAGGEISEAYVSRLEAGQRRPDYAVAVRLAQRLDTTVEYLATGQQPADPDAVVLTVQYAELALRSGEAKEATEQLQPLVDAGEWLGDQQLQVLHLLGLAREALGDLDAAAAMLERAIDSADGVERLRVATALCRCYREAGDLARSIQVGEQAKQAAADGGVLSVDDEVRLTLTLSAAYFERGDVVYAAHLCHQALDRAEAHDSPSARAAAYWNASVIAAERGRQRDALAMADRALALLSEGDDRRNLARLRLQHGAILLAQDSPDLAAAREELTQARHALTTSDASVVDVARCDIELARADALGGDLEQADRRALDAARAVGNVAPFVAAAAEVLQGQVAATRDEPSEALAHYRRAVALLTGAQADRDVAQLWYHLGELLESAGDEAGARDAYRSASAAMGLRRSTALAINRQSASAAPGPVRGAH